MDAKGHTMTANTKPRLSELIRKGAILVDGRQARRDYIRLSKSGDVFCCALGAAYYALENKLPKSDKVIWGDLRYMLHNATGCPMDDIFNVVKMNDVEGKSFVQIAAALEARGL
jgi:tartrate dehydratase beta subunit/fumarate hydratase class I family protein